MAEIPFPTPYGRRSWLDRPLLPTWQRLAALLVHWELIAYISIVLIGLTLRIWDVGGRAMHHDESLHAYYSWLLYAGKGYSYDPLMHGPFQFEVVPIFYLLFGVSEMSARLLAVVLGTALISLPYFLRSYVTRPGALLTAVMLAVSPAFVYFSRFIRDDIYLAFFSLILFIAIVRYIESRRVIYMYLGAVAAALAMASMEAAYITFFIFGSFLVFEGVREYMTGRDGPVLNTLRSTTLDVWLTTLSIFVVITVLLFSTFFTNPYGIWDPRHPLCIGTCFTTHPVWSSDRKDILGGIAYWLAQHSVQRGGQPWFYYLLLMPLYEQLAVVFGLAGIVLAVVRRSLVTTFLVWWAVLGLLMYSWAGEKMPWLVIHIALPFILLAGLFLGWVLTSGRRALLATSGCVFALLLALEVHSTFLLNYVDGANPTEMLIYVQTSQDVPNVVHEINGLANRMAASHKIATPTALPIGLDTNDVGGWPFTWYLRNYSSVTETTGFSGPQCGGQYCPVLLMLGPEYDQYGAQLASRYVAQKYRWNWWFPEDYKQWFPEHWGNIPQALQGKGSLAEDLFGTPADRMHVWDWLMYRQPFGDRAARWLYVLVRRDLVPGGKSLGTGLAGTTPGVGAPTLPASLRTALGASGLGQLAGPRGIALARNGTLFVADTLNHRIVSFSPGGRVLHVWGSVGAGPGQFSSNSSPMGLAVGPDGNVYVADTWNQRIQVFSPGGRFIRQWGGGPIGAGPGQFYGPRSIAVSRSGNVYVADTGNKRIQVFSLSGHYLSSWGTAGASPGQFMEPSSVAIGPNGVVYVSDFWNQRIQAFSAAGQYLRSWQVPDWTPQSYDEPYLAVDPRSGDVFASDPSVRQVLVFSPTGQTLGRFGVGQLSVPIGLAVGRAGTVDVSDSIANRVDVFTLRALRPPALRSVTRSAPRSRLRAPKVKQHQKL